MILGIDPGPEKSAWVLLDGTRVLDAKTAPNADVRRDLAAMRLRFPAEPPVLALEMIQSFGLPVGAEVFQTCVWIGRFLEVWGGPHTLVYRRDVKLYLCGVSTAKDPHIRQALIDRFGPGKERAIGKKAAPGPLYGITGDEWSALAVAVTAQAAASTRLLRPSRPAGWARPGS